MDPIKHSDSEPHAGRRVDVLPDGVQAEYTFNPKAAGPHYLAIQQSQDQVAWDELVAVEFGRPDSGPWLSAMVVDGRGAKNQVRLQTCEGCSRREHRYRVSAHIPFKCLYA